jgi:hypothetical protein
MGTKSTISYRIVKNKPVEEDLVNQPEDCPLITVPEIIQN